MKLANFEMGVNPGTLAAGAAALFLGPIVLPAARNPARAVAKSGMKGGMKVYSRTSSTSAVNTRIPEMSVVGGRINERPRDDDIWVGGGTMLIDPMKAAVNAI